MLFAAPMPPPPPPAASVQAAAGCDDEPPDLRAAFAARSGSLLRGGRSALCSAAPGDLEDAFGAAAPAAFEVLALGAGEAARVRAARCDLLRTRDVASAACFVCSFVFVCFLFVCLSACAFRVPCPAV